MTVKYTRVEAAGLVPTVWAYDGEDSLERDLALYYGDELSRFSRTEIPQTEATGAELWGDRTFTDWYMGRDKTSTYNLGKLK